MSLIPFAVFSPNMHSAAPLELYLKERRTLSLKPKTGIERCRPPKKLSALDKYVIFSLSAVIIFTLIAIVYQWLHDDELSGTLITCFFACFGGELLSLAMIKRLKLKKGETDERPDI